jgi:hypothetical protein
MKEELHTRADAAHGAAGRERYTSGGSMPQAGDHRTNLLQVEAAGSGHGDRGADSATAVGRREQEVESAGTLPPFTLLLTRREEYLEGSI